ncbi:hypothetical protein [Empedobacter sp. UBA1574]|uniref:hypothetical protein n=1 Tax=Empedobacter sp. UBA1574 TaxID=1946429 RepID=UPI0025BB7338|nr:hypothetical protein [Empedobacter sp. UBA1574]
MNEFLYLNKYKINVSAYTFNADSKNDFFDIYNIKLQNEDFKEKDNRFFALSFPNKNYFKELGSIHKPNIKRLILNNLTKFSKDRFINLFKTENDNLYYGSIRINQTNKKQKSLVLLQYYKKTNEMILIVIEDFFPEVKSNICKEVFEINNSIIERIDDLLNY